MAAIEIDFSELRFDLQKIAESRILSQYTTSPLYKKLLEAITSEVQELLDAIVDLMEYRTVAKAKGKQLDILGKIVGQPRSSYNYGSSFWFMPDEDGVGADNGRWWISAVPQAVEEEMDDETYRNWIWLRILSNHNLFSSTPELENAILEGLDESVGIERVGMMEGKIYAESTISLTNYNLLDYNKDTPVVDNEYLFAYPATTVISSKVKV